MNTPTPDLSVEILTEYSATDAAMIGKLLPHLSNNFSDAPVSEQTLRDIIDSPLHEQFVARTDAGVIVGIATVSITFGAAVGRRAWLEDFVIDPDTQGMGIGSKLWDTIMLWCHDHQVGSLGFTSRASRAAAQSFYLKRGAIIRDTNFFKKQIE